MSILVDTSVWSLGLRRRKRDLNSHETVVYYAWRQLLIHGEAVVIGPICQEVLSGVAAPNEFAALQERLGLVDDLPLEMDTFILAAEFYNTCRTHGIAPGTVDMTICAAAHLNSVPIFTTDPDFTLYARHLPIALHTI